jgi:alanine racemase
MTISLNRTLKYVFIATHLQCANEAQKHSRADASRCFEAINSAENRKQSLFKGQHMSSVNIAFLRLRLASTFT